MAKVSARRGSFLPCEPVADQLMAEASQGAYLFTDRPPAVDGAPKPAKREQNRDCL
jgi:hypothetical protein